MDAAEETRGERWARRVRHALSAAVVALVALLALDAVRGEGLFSVPPAQATAIAAAPNFITLSTPTGANSFYIIDSAEEVICVYQMRGDTLRLVSVRNFTKDTDIMDSSIETIRGSDGKPIKIEGGSGVTTQEAKEYADQLQKYMEDAEKKR
ncbi:MAG: hypothetical protein AMXMBFR7_01410 [Planctomycetota bacterium]